LTTRIRPTCCLLRHGTGSPRILHPRPRARTGPRPHLRPLERELRGYPPHHPQMMVALLLYAYAVGVPSSRKIERRTHEDIAFRVIAGGTHPDHTRISEF